MAINDDSIPSLIGREEWPLSPSHPVVTPLQASVVYAAQDPDMLDAQYDSGEGYIYAREGHPNADVLARMIDRLEGAKGGIITGSGMAAISAGFIGALKAGDHVLGGNQLYGRTLRMMAEDLPRLGIETSLADPTDIAAMRAAIRPNTRMIIVEVISNPTIRVADMEGLVQLARETGVLLAVDNTFTTPRLYQPLLKGADIVIHSVTKLLSGHSDATLGYIACRDPALMEAVRIAAATWGLTPSPFDCWLAERGLLSFDLRAQRADDNAAALAQALGGCPAIARVIYPARHDHPDHNRSMCLLGGRGGNMLSFELHGGREAANRFARAASGISFAPTLGDVGTTLSHPASSSHRALSPDERAKLNISEGFFRISAGVEPTEALVNVLKKAAKSAE